MKTLKTKCFFVVLSTLIFASLLALSVNLLKSEPKFLTETVETLDLSENKVFGVRISQFEKLNALTFGMMTEGEFVQTGHQPGKIGSEEFFSLETSASGITKGSYRFVILNLDPLDPNYDKEAKKLAPYLKGDNAYHFTLYLPAVFSSCTVYVSSVLTEVNGEISNYNFTDFSNNLGETTVHKSGTQPVFIDLSFYSKRASLPPATPIVSGKIVTIHFEGSEIGPSGIFGMPLIGEDEAVRSAAGKDGLTLALISIVSLVIFAVFTFLCFLKKSLKFLPQQFVVLGLLGVFVSLNALSVKTAAPEFWLVFKNVSFALVLFSSIMSLKVKIKDFKIWMIGAGFGGLMCLFAGTALHLGLPYEIYGTIMRTGILVGTVMLLALVLAYSFSKSAEYLTVVAPAIAVVLGFVSVMTAYEFFIFTSPHFWLAALMLGVNVVTSFNIFINLERKNRFLTTNLANEVSRQTDKLREIILERDNLLRHVSHDMKKPVRSIHQFVTSIKNNKEEAANPNALNLIEKKTDELLREFDELGNFAKLNFVAERSVQFNVGDTLFSTFESLQPDCVANGVVLKLENANIEVYGKPTSLRAILNNLIINALEHADCSSILLTATKKEEFCHILVSDNGRGIAEDINVFAPYSSSASSNDNGGLGLYISKTLAKSMGGDISFVEQDGFLTFTITLPLS